MSGKKAESLQTKMQLKKIYVPSWRLHPLDMRIHGLRASNQQSMSNVWFDGWATSLQGWQVSWLVTCRPSKATYLIQIRPKQTHHVWNRSSCDMSSKSFQSKYRTARKTNHEGTVAQQIMFIYHFDTLPIAARLLLKSCDSFTLTSAALESG